MRLLKRASQILELKPTDEDLSAGANYAAITLPWTFNRMMLNTGSRGQQRRALNIAKGIIAQEILRRVLLQNRVEAQLQRKSHRDEDLFDFNIVTEKCVVKLDVKSFNFYSDYDTLGRTPLNPRLIIENSDYPGPDWRRFFPMLVPHTQIGQDKEAYCFAMASSIDFRRDIDTNRIGYSLTAFPYSTPTPFLCSKRLCQAREEAGKGFYITCSYLFDSLFNGSKIEFTIIGEWNGKLKKERIKLGKNQEISNIGPFSCIDSFQISRSDYDKFNGKLLIFVSKNEFRDPIFNTSRRNINVEPDEVLTYTVSDFCNLMLPKDFKLFVIGWTTKDIFIEKCQEYTGWVWPDDKINKYHNQAWSQITDADQKLITRLGFQDSIQNKPRLLKAGLMKTHGHGGGACCYVFPNIGRNGGVKETNLYILPKDLCIIHELGK